MNEAQILQAKLDEAEAVIASLRGRTVALNLEVRARAQRIEELEALIVQQDEDERTAS